VGYTNILIVVFEVWNNKLSKDRIKELEKFPGWSWNMYETLWIEALHHLEKYVSREGHSRVPENYKTEDGFRLGRWVSRCRNNYKSNKLSKDQIKELGKFPGWTWGSSTVK